MTARPVDLETGMDRIPVWVGIAALAALCVVAAGAAAGIWAVVMVLA